MTAAEKVYEELTELGFFTRYYKDLSGEEIYVQLQSPVTEQNLRFFELLARRSGATKHGLGIPLNRYYWKFPTS